MEAKDTVLKVADLPKGVEQFYPFTPGELRKELGIQAEVSFQAGMQEVVDWITVEHQYLWLPTQQSVDAWQQFLKEHGLK